MRWDKVKYKVIKDIEEGWETGANVGDILSVRNWKGVITLMKDDKAVCDLESEYEHDYCERIES